VTPTTELETELRAFFEGYARAFHADLDRFCDYFHFPSATVRLDGTLQPLPTKDEAVDFFSAAKQKYEAEGCTHWAIDRLAAQPLGAGSAAATIDWTMRRADDTSIRGWTQTYNVIGSANGWHVLLSTLHVGSESVAGAAP
jgi:hypothetical protein